MDTDPIRIEVLNFDMNKYKKKKKNFIKSKISKKLVASTGAALLALCVAGAGLWQYLQPVPAEAKETFSGIKQVVAERNGESPFVILDIVPGYANYTCVLGDGNLSTSGDSGASGSSGDSSTSGDSGSSGTSGATSVTVEVPLATLPYLTNGVTPAEQAVINAIKANPAAFYETTNRAALAENLIPKSMNTSMLNVKYEEGYGSITEGLTEANGWTKVYDAADYNSNVAKDALYTTYPSGVLYGKVDYITKKEGEPLPEGYDYILLNDTSNSNSSNDLNSENSILRDTQTKDGLIAPVVEPETQTVEPETQPTGETPTDEPENGDTSDEPEPSDEPETPADETKTSDEPKSPTTEDSGTGNGETQPTEETQTVEPETGSGGTETGDTSTDEIKTSDETKTQPDGTGNGSGTGNGNDETASLSTKWYRCVDISTDEETQTNEENQPTDGTQPTEEPSTTEEPSMNEATQSTDGTPADETEQPTEETPTVETNSSVNSASQAMTDAGTVADAGTGTVADAGNTYVYVGNASKVTGTTYYKITQLSEDSTDPDAQILNILNAPVYIRCRNQNDWLKQYVFNSLAGEENASENFTIQIQTIEANKVTAEMIAEADLIYLEDGMTVFEGDDSDFQKHYISADDSGSLGTDMSKDAVFGIVYRAVNDLLPVMVDYGIVTNSTDYANTNYQKLAKIMLKKDLLTYYEEMESADNLLMNISSSDYPDKTDNNYNYVNRNIYIINDSPLAGEDFNKAFEESKINAGFKEVMAAIQAENSTLSEENKIAETVSKAKVVQYIINYAVGLISDFKDIRVLELQPTTNSISDLHVSSNEEKKNTTLYWKKADSKNAGQQILRSSKVIDITVDSKSVDEFAGETTDINDVYQIIFIGLDGQRLNYENKKTVYNDSSLNGKVYTAAGDIADDSGNRYAGIDLTQEKKNALLDFMRAGYPIVVEDNFFKDKTAKEVGSEAVNTKYIEENSQMYDFLKRAVSEYQDYIYTISDVHSSTLFPAQINMRRPQIAYQEQDTASVQSVTADAEGNYKGTIAYRITDDRGDAYPGEVSVRLYFDLNNDGKYEEAEEVGSNGYSNDNGTIVVDFDETNRGMIPWKLEVSDSGNSFRRDDLRGFFLLSDAKLTPVQILQIAEESADESVNLEKTYDVSNTLLGYYLRSAEGLTGSIFEIKTITPQQLQNNLAKQEDYLEGWDILVLGFGASYSLGDAADAVNHYIEENRPVVISSAALSVENDCMGLSKALLGISDTGTYVRLGSAKGSQKYYRFNCLKEEMFGARQNLTIERTNDGMLSHYPYEIDAGSAMIYQSVEAGDYLLDFAQNDTADGQTAVTAWYSLGNSLVESDFNAYEVSRQDGANNYYVYSKGNVVCVGQDSYPFLYDSVAGNDPFKEDGAVECQIFVNALMTAYNAGIKNPKVSLVAGFSLDAPEVESICIPFDQQMLEDGDEQQGLLTETTDVYFKMSDPNLAFSKAVDISFYYKDDAGGEIDIGGETVHATSFSSTLWRVENGQLVTVGEQEELQQGVIYKIKAPVTALRDSSKTGAEIYVIARSTFQKYGKEQVAVGSDSVTISRAQLFLLE